MLSTVLNIIIFEDCRNQWSMSRPLLGLILLNEKYFADLRNSIVNSQPPEKQQAMHLCFENLMEGIERNLLTKNRDRFTQNLSVFRREVNDSMKNSTYGVTSPPPPPLRMFTTDLATVLNPPHPRVKFIGERTRNLSPLSLKGSIMSSVDLIR
ncbi:hypothetical protein G5714_011023 [Onychostoma macrolepis]|uniref:XPO7 n=1 Tax=Onychostoma macrolepis TaxID=369639 RepID=A0A7J6CMI3_9TELE|nr:hypothetical protein G5714_011023 [Onychostoma macrolepis]